VFPNSDSLYLECSCEDLKKEKFGFIKNKINPMLRFYKQINNMWICVYETEHLLK
jgi:hypothetical protein